MSVDELRQAADQFCGGLFINDKDRTLEKAALKKVISALVKEVARLDEELKTLRNK